MAKILKVEIVTVPETVIADDNETDLEVSIEIEFHKLDIVLGMEYMLYAYLFDVHGSIDVPILLTNWDESKILTVNQENRNDDILGISKLKIHSKNDKKKFVLPMSIRLGKFKTHGYHLSRRLQVFASIIPAIDKCSKRSKSFETNIIY